jgi:hypothetical protein
VLGARGTVRVVAFLLMKTPTGIGSEQRCGNKAFFARMSSKGSRVFDYTTDQFTVILEYCLGPVAGDLQSIGLASSHRNQQVVM